MTGYVVIDVQTTGLDPARHDRIVEIGVGVLDESARTLEAWDSLVNPKRDIGETERHHITARDVLDAPTFGALAPHVLKALDGRLIVAHNARFDMLFLVAELERAGVVWRDYPPVALCTMELAAAYLPDSRRSLTSCCQKAGINLGQRFSSSAHVKATSELLAWYIDQTENDLPWAELHHVAGRHLWPIAEAGGAALKPRSAIAATTQMSWLERIVDHMQPVGDPDIDAYLAALDMALLDRYLSAREETSLVALADQLGIGRDRLSEVHFRYLTAMATAALADDVVTEEERADLIWVAGLLGLAGEDVDRAFESAEPGEVTILGLELVVGDHVTLTGAMKTSRDLLAQRAHESGLRVGALTKSTKLLVAADPDTSSGKGLKAAHYGVPVVTEDAFLSMLARMSSG